MRKWVMMPADAEQTIAEKIDVTKEDLISVIKLSKQNLLDDNGNLLQGGKSIANIHEVITLKSKHKAYKYYLELKTDQPKKSNKKAAAKKTTTKKSSTWDWQND